MGLSLSLVGDASFIGRLAKDKGLDRPGLLDPFGNDARAPSGVTPIKVNSTS